MDETLTRKFVTLTNQMYASLTLYETDRNLGRQESNDSLMQCARIGCFLLGNAVFVQALVDDMMTLNERAAAEVRGGIQAITAAEHFDFFLAGEGRLLEAAGTDSLLITAILDQCRGVQQAARQGSFSPLGFPALEDLRHAACRVLAELGDAAHGYGPPGWPPPGWAPPSTLDLPPLPPTPPPGSPPIRSRYPRLKACFKGVCGCVVVGLDASALAGTLGITTAGSAVSIALGAAIVDNALSDLRVANQVRLPSVPPVPSVPSVPPVPQRWNPPEFA